MINNIISNNNYWVMPIDHINALIKNTLIKNNYSESPVNELLSFYQIKDVAVLPIRGTLLKNVGLFKWLKIVDVEILKNTLIELSENNSINHIVLDCDSPGGSVAGIQETAECIYEIRSKKNIYAYTSGMIASGMYWLASACSGISASETSMIGSIGVIYTHFDWSKSNEQMGLKVTDIVSGKWKALGNTDVPLTTEKENKIQERVDEIANIFISSISKYRKHLSEEKIASFEADVFLGKTAKQNGLIDNIETLDNLLNRLTGKRINLKGRDNIMNPENKEDIKAESKGTDNKTEKIETQSINQTGVNEKERILTILNRCKVAGIDEKNTQAFISSDMSVDDVTEIIFQSLESKQEKIDTKQDIQLVSDEKDKFVNAATSGLMSRLGIKQEKQAPGAREFIGLSLIEMSKKILNKNGFQVNGMTRNQVAGKILSFSASATTSDFPMILSNIANKRLMDSYVEYQPTFKPFVRVVSASDFKDITGLKLSEAPDLELVNEAGEYKIGDFAEGQEKYVVKSYGKITYLTRQMIINDDLRAFSRIPELFGHAALRKESDIVYNLLLSNPIMEDGENLFSTAHKNIASSGADINVNSLSEARTAMRKQTGIKGAVLDITPSFLLIPLEKETNAHVLLASVALPEEGKSSGVINPFHGKLTPIAEPRLSKDSTTAWYLLASPTQTETIEMAYLDGQETPFIDEDTIFERDAVGIKIRHEFGVGIMDHVGFFKNSG